MKAVPIVILLVFAADALLCLLYLGNFAIGQPVNVVNTLLDLNDEIGLGTWYSSIKLFVVAQILALFAFTQASFMGSWIFAALSATFLGLSADEIVQIHEFAGEKLDILLPSGERENTMFSETGIWMFAIGIPAIGVIALLFHYAASRLRLPRPACKKYLAGLAVFAAGAMGAETVSNFVEGTGDILCIAAEESLEMFGVTILLYGSIELLQTDEQAHRLLKSAGFETMTGKIKAPNPPAPASGSRP